MEHLSTVIGTGYPWVTEANARKLVFAYDYLGRRVRKTTYEWNSSTSAYKTTVKTDTKFLYDGWNLIAEFDSLSTLTLTRSHTWGLDVTGSLTASGGVGALLQTYDSVAGKTLLPAYDGNGNVAALLNASTGDVEAAYEYDPFGNLLRNEGSYASSNNFRFSTKFTDTESGLVYYGHRYFSTTLGRFINKDPIEESGGLNLYGFCGNNGVNRWDYLGQIALDRTIGAPGDDDAVTITGYRDPLTGGATDSGMLTSFGGPILSGLEAYLAAKAATRAQYQQTMADLYNGLTRAWNAGVAVQASMMDAFRNDPGASRLTASRGGEMNSDGTIDWVHNYGEAAGSGREGPVGPNSPRASSSLVTSTGQGGIPRPETIDFSTLRLGMGLWDRNRPDGYSEVDESTLPDFEGASNRYSIESRGVIANSQIAEILEVSGGSPSTALFFHGNTGRTGVGSQDISDEQWKAIGRFTAVIYLLGCDLIRTREGFQRAQQLANISGATIYATPWDVGYPGGRVVNVLQLPENQIERLTPTNTVQMYQFKPK